MKGGVAVKGAIMDNRKVIDKRAVIKSSVAALVLVVTCIVGLLCFYSIGESEEVAVLKMGSSGSQVRTLQTKLNNWGYNAGKVDGIFGSNTREAVKRFQRKNGLAVDGIVGAKTAAALGMTLSSGSSSNSSYNNSDVYLLAWTSRGGSRRTQQSAQFLIPKFHIRSDISTVCVYGGCRRTDKLGAQFFGILCGA